MYCSPFHFTIIVAIIYVLSYLPVCEKDVQKVCANSSEENLQPFKDKMEGFISAGESVTAFFRKLKPQMRT